MHPQQLDELLNREPFVPIRLHLSNGDQIDVRNPGLAFIHRLAVYLFRVDRPHTNLVDDHRLISLRHIVHVEFIADGSSPQLSTSA